MKNFIISKYDDLSNEFHGVDLYEKIISEALTYSNDKWNLEVPMMFLVVYIFDKCDIFERE